MTAVSFKMMNFAFKMMDFVLKMMDFGCSCSGFVRFLTLKNDNFSLKMTTRK